MPGLHLAIQLQRDLDTGCWYVNRVEAARGNVKTKTSFTSPMPLQKVFQTEVSVFISSNLPIRLDPMVLSIDSRAFDRLGVLFLDVRIISQRAFAGIQSVTVRIKKVVGRVFEIYKSDLQLESDTWLGGSEPNLRLLGS